MQEIRCPKCGEVFQVDESGYAAIVKQVRDREFEHELHLREESFRNEKESAVTIAVNRTEAEKTQEIEELRRRLARADADRDAALEKLRRESDQRLAERERGDLWPCC